MCWMHKGAYACSRELVVGADTDKFVRFFLRMCEVLRYYKIKPIIVFDGEKLPAKAKEDQRRGQLREAARLRALELLQQKEKGEEVDDFLIQQKCETAIKVTSSMVSRLQSALRELSIDFLVAPYEADAQLAYMCRTGWISTAISEDSDLLAYGCPSTFFKMDKYGNGQHITLPCLQVDHVGQELAIESPEKQKKKPRSKKQAKKPTKSSPVEEIPDEAEMETEAKPVDKVRKSNAKSPQGLEDAEKEIQSHLNSWPPEKFAEFCVFCGTDYKDPDTHIKNFGIKKAFALMCKHSTTQGLLSWMLAEKSYKDRFPCDRGEYPQRFQRVVAVFWHHVVFNPARGECTSIATSFPLTSSKRVLEGLDLQEVCGRPFSRQEAILMAKGEMDPRTRQPKRLEALTNAERRAIDLMLADKRSEQSDYRHQVALEEEEARKRAKMEETTDGTEAVEPEVPDVPEPTQHDQEKDQGNDCNDRGIQLIPGDERKILRFLEMKNEFSKAKADVKMDVSGKSSTNPFARKRVVATPCSNGRAVATAPVPVSKRAKVVVPKVALGTPPVEAPQRPLKNLASHSKGGYAAAEAAQALLLQRGIPQYEKLEEDQDRTKVKYFFPPKTEKEKTPAMTTKSKLSEWKPRSWEDDTEKSSSVGRNSLSIRGRGLPQILLRSGWG